MTPNWRSQTFVRSNIEQHVQYNDYALVKFVRCPCGFYNYDAEIIVPMKILDAQTNRLTVDQPDALNSSTTERRVNDTRTTTNNDVRMTHAL